MKYSELVPQVFVTSVSGVVPYIEGHAGVGKSQIVKDVAEMYREKGFEKVPVVKIFGSLLKEGELGGIPFPYKDEKGRMVNNYTTHVKIQELLDNDEKGLNTILFIDEINRCENAVQQELMQLILDRQVNYTKIPDSVIIMAAGNPEYDDDVDYQVNVMNDAMKNRFVKYTLEADAKDWLQWASNTADNSETGEEAMDTDIIEFIAEFPNLLHDPHAKEDIKPTPRGWELLSKTLRQIKSYFPEKQEDMLLEAAKGVVGTIPAQQLINFLRNKENPLITAAEIFKSSDKDFKAVIEKFSNDTSTRQFITTDRCIKFLMEESSLKEPELKRFISVCDALPKDIMIGVLKNIGMNFRKLHEALIKYDAYMDLFFETNAKIVNSNL